MSDPTRDQLLGYLLGALDDDEQKTLEQRLADDPALRHDLTLLNRALAPLDGARRQFDPPPGLAARTCQLVAELPARAKNPSVETRPRPAVHIMRDADMLGDPAVRFRWQDLLMVAGVLLASLVILFPALHNSRVQARLLACQDNLRQLGTALTDYSQQHDGWFPQLPTKGPLAAASAFGPILAQQDYLDDDRIVVCPSSPLAEEDEFHIPSLAELEAADPIDELPELQERMGGSYGYNLGYQDDSGYHAPKNLGRAYYAIASDAPSDSLPQRQSINHGRYGQNVLFEDNHVCFLLSPYPAEIGDNLFLNDDGDVAAGTNQDDSVIGAGATPPIQYISSE
ncbi:MAG: hypothetical protein JW818_19700 [Pirellulales bacterium]|nr:hypothetical protein [Pirellulales bacterium]